MVLSRGQSALLGGFFLQCSFADRVPTTIDMVPYASLGAFYFLPSALWFTV